MTQIIAADFASITKTPLGYIQAVADEAGLVAINWQQEPFDASLPDNDVSRETLGQLHDYFGGARQAFTIPISDKAVSASMHLWLAAIANVPYGETVSYADLAGIWGNKRAARAAGSACQRNPLPILIPCHRIIGSNGAYDKYSGGDRTSPTSAGNIARKKALLDLEAGLRIIS